MGSMRKGRRKSSKLRSKRTKPRGITDRTSRLYRRWSDRARTARYLLRKRRSGKTWARAVAIHARQKTALAVSGVSIVRRLHQAGVAEYWFRQRVGRMPLTDFADSDVPLYSPRALYDLAEELAIQAGKPWGTLMPTGLRAIFVVEALEASVGASRSFGPGTIAPSFVWEASCSAKREWLDTKHDGLPGEVLDWLEYLSDRNPHASVIGWRTHLRYYGP